MKELEGPFDKFVQSDSVNSYLQTIGPTVLSEIYEVGVYHEFVIVSGYEEERGNWATAYDNLIRFGEEIIAVQDLNKAMVLTPNFFYGKNNFDEEIEYRMGLIKGAKRFHLCPVLLKKTSEGIKSQILRDLCVIHTGIMIDPKTAEIIGWSKVAEITSHQQFLSTFWNIDDYLRKQNPKFYSDFNIDIWTTVEVFSSRIIDQMLYNIAEGFLKDISWLIPQIEKKYLHDIFDKIKTYWRDKNIINENHILNIVQNLCSCAVRFENFELFDELVEYNLNILLYIIKNLGSPDSRVRKETNIVYERVRENFAHLIERDDLKILRQMFFHENEMVRGAAKETYGSAIIKNPHLIDAKEVSEYNDLFSDLHWRETAQAVDLILAIKMVGIGKATRFFHDIVPYLKHEDPNVRASAAEVLGELDNSKAIGPLILCLNDHESDIRAKATMALIKLKQYKIIESLAKRLKDGDSDERKITKTTLILLKKMFKKYFRKNPQAIKDLNPLVEKIKRSLRGQKKRTSKKK